MRVKMYIVVILLIMLISAAFAVFGQNPESDACRTFLAEYGWETEDEIFSHEEINIPNPFDSIFEDYNRIQKEAGLDLSSCRGKRGTRYTFIIKNYPADVGETVYANVICIDGEPVGGDIMTAGLNGFMHSLLRPSIEQTQ